MSPEIEALAEAWASIDGRLNEFRHGRAHPKSRKAQREGYYEGYLWDAKELASRLLRRGYKLVPSEPDPSSKIVCIAGWRKPETSE